MPPVPTIVPRTLGHLDYFAIALFFAINLLVGYWCGRRQKKDGADFFLGGGRIRWWAAAISFFATATSSISFMALPAKTYAQDWRIFLSAPAQALGGCVVGLLFVRLLRRLELVSVFTYLERRFDRRVQLTGAALGILVKVLGRMSVVILLPSLALSTVTGLNVYVSISLIGVVTTIYALDGGFEAVVWTDILQAGVMLGGVAVALTYLGAGVDGGLAGVVRVALTENKFHLVDWVPDFTQPTAIVFFAQFVATIFIQVGDQPLMQRMLSTTREREAGWIIIVGNTITCLSSILFFFVGTALWAFYRAHPERLATGLPNDTILPYFIANELPTGVVGMIVASLFAAAMGAHSSILNSTATVIVSDFQGAWHPQATTAQKTRLARLTTVLCGALGIGMAGWLASKNAESLWDEFMRLIARFGGGFAGVFGLGLLTRRAHAHGVLIGAVASIGVSWWVQQSTALNAFAQGFVAIATCVVLGYLASLVLPSPRPNQSLTGLTLWDPASHPGNHPTR